jgi:hypothetical protein
MKLTSRLLLVEQRLVDPAVRKDVLGPQALF